MIKHNNLTHLLLLKEKAEKLTYKRGETIVSTDYLDSVWFVEAGFIKRFQILNTGSLRVQGFYAAGDVFPLTYIFQLFFDREIYHGLETYYYQAMTTTTVYKIKGSLLLDLSHVEPLVYRDLLSIAGNKLLSDVQLLENHGMPDALKRLAQLLASYGTRYGKEIKDVITLDIPFTQQDIADILSVSRETVSLNMQNLKKRHLITGTKIITIPSFTLLQQFAYR